MAKGTRTSWAASPLGSVTARQRRRTCRAGLATSIMRHVCAPPCCVVRHVCDVSCGVLRGSKDASLVTRKTLKCCAARGIRVSRTRKGVAPARCWCAEARRGHLFDGRARRSLLVTHRVRSCGEDLNLLVSPTARRRRGIRGVSGQACEGRWIAASRNDLRDQTTALRVPSACAVRTAMRG
jgi:hypothetical protein